MRQRLLILLLVALPLLAAGLLLTHAVLAGERERAAGEALRLALWRLEARATALVVGEASRAPEAYRSFWSPTEAFGERLPPADRILLPSPLLALPPPPLHLHLRLAGGTLASPQVPIGRERILALGGLLDAADLAEAGRRFAALRAALGRDPELLLAGLPAPPSAADSIALPSTEPLRQESPAPMPAAAPLTQAGMAAQPAAAEVPAAAPSPLAQRAQAQNQQVAVGAQADQVATVEQQQALGEAGNGDFGSRVSSVAEAQRFAQLSNDSNSLGSRRSQAKPKAAPATSSSLGSSLAPAAPAPAPVVAAAPTPGPVIVTTASPQVRNEARPKLDPADTASRPAPVPSAIVAKPLTEAKAPVATAPAADQAAPPPTATSPVPPPPTTQASAVGLVEARWAGADWLLLARRARLDGREELQAAALRWEELRALLTTSLADLLPRARLVPRAPGDPVERCLAALPIRLDPGMMPVPPLSAAARWTLGIAWGALLAGLAGAGALLLAAQRLAERRAAFVSAVTHELRTPLTALRLHADLLADARVADDPARRGARVEVVRAEAGRLAHLVDNVLDYARLERRRPPQPHALPLTELLAPLRPRLAARLAAAGLELVAGEPPPCVVRCDAAAVERILLNLADNAAKYAVAGEPKRVTLGALLGRNCIELRLRDHGPGLAADVRARLFLPFARSAETAAGSAPGVGLGLALCRRLARAQGGDLRLEEPANGGVEAVLTLPLAG